MTKKYKKPRPATPGWVDSLIVVLEFIGVIATILAGIYALVTLIF